MRPVVPEWRDPHIPDKAINSTALPIMPAVWYNGYSSLMSISPLLAETAPVTTNPRQMLALLGASLALGLMFDQLFYQRLPGISWFIFVVAVLFGLVMVTRLWHRPLGIRSLWLIGPLLVISALVGVRASAELTFLNIVVSVFLLLLIAVQATGKQVEHFLLVDYLKTLFAPLLFVPKFFTVLIEAFTMRLLVKHPRTGAIVKGVVMALPALVIFAVLFASADLVFKKYLNDAVSIHISPDVLFQAGLVIFVGAVMLGAYGFILKTRAHITHSQPPTTKIGATEIQVMLGLINGLFILFVLVQLRYLFGGEEIIRAQGFTYAEYARRGFFELMAVALIAFFIVWAAEQSIVRTNGRLPPSFSWLSLLLNVQVMVIMVSAFQRMNLYEQAYGFTTLRWFAHALIIGLSVLVLMFINKIVRHQGEAVFLRQALAVGILFLVTVNLANPDRFVAQQNWDRFQQTGKLDPMYVRRLSTDATPVALQALEAKNLVVRSEIGQYLYQQSETLTSPTYHRWPSYNLSRQAAVRVLDQHRAVLTTYKNISPPSVEDLRQLIP